MQYADPSHTPPQCAPFSTHLFLPAPNPLSPSPPATYHTSQTTLPSPIPPIAAPHPSLAGRSAPASVPADAQDNAADSCIFACLICLVQKNANKNVKQYLLTPVNVSRLSSELLHHPDSDFSNYLLSGLSHPGVKILPMEVCSRRSLFYLLYCCNSRNSSRSRNLSLSSGRFHVQDKK